MFREGFLIVMEMVSLSHAGGNITCILSPPGNTADKMGWPSEISFDE